MNYPFLKIFDKRVTIEMDYAQDVGASYLWIDVFPIDGLPADDKTNRSMFAVSLFLRKLLLISNAKIGKGTSMVRTIAKIPVYFILKPLGKYRIARWIDTFCQRYSFDESAYVGGLVWGYGPQERMPRQEWLARTKVEFEQYSFWAPGCWDYYLTQLYGDYMKLPPKHERVAHCMKIQFKEV
jgi:lipopolysaccharide cholinephosphotransferase